MQQQTPIVVVGAGTMGTTLARLMATRAMPVTVLDIDGTRLAHCREALAADETLSSRVGFAQDWSSVGAASAMIESVTEDLALKRRVLAEAERHLPATALIMTNTSGLSIDALGEEMAHPERFVGAHFFNPADLIPAVELVPGQLTHDATVAQACQLLRQLGKRPAVLKRCVPGFVANRIQHALMRECLALLEQGVVEPQALDDIVRYSIGVRLAINGPLRQRDLNGLDTHLNIARYLYAELEDRHTPSPLLETHVSEGRLGRKSGRGFFDWPQESAEAQPQQERELLRRMLTLLDEESAS